MWQRLAGGFYSGVRVNKSPAYVYAIEDGKYIKIGVALSVVKRFTVVGIMHYHNIERKLGEQIGARLRVVGARFSERPYSDELALHHKLKADRVSGEWFLMTPEVMKVVYAYMDGRCQQ